MASFNFPDLWCFFLRLNWTAYQKCQRMQRHGETKTAESLSLITECACGYNKAKKRTACTSSTLLFYAALSAMGKEQKKKKNAPWSPHHDHSKGGSQAILEGKSDTTLSARCACVCTDINQEKKGKSVADMLARRALTRSRLVRQVSSVLPLTAGKMGMAPWANLRGSFTTRDNVHVACLHHSRPTFPRHSEKPWHLPPHWGRNEKMMTRQNWPTTSLFHMWREGEKKEENTELPAAHNSHSPTMSHHTKQLPKSSSKLKNDFQFWKCPVQNL